MQEKKLLNGGDPGSDDHKELKDNGQQKDYVVLSDAERQKGFVRPVRNKYIHTGVLPRFPLRDLTEEEKVSMPEYSKYEEFPESESPACGKFWTEKQLKGGCGAETIMSWQIAETYAADPGFYGATFCVKCRVHLPVAEFTWSKSDQKVGS